MTQREDDWARIVIGWIADAERQMDEAYRMDDGRGYVVASRQRDDMQMALNVVDPTARFRFALQGMTTGIDGLRRALERSGHAWQHLAEATQRPDA